MGKAEVREGRGGLKAPMKRHSPVSAVSPGDSSRSDNPGFAGTWSLCPPPISRRDEVSSGLRSARPTGLVDRLAVPRRHSAFRTV